ncbi:hypothetical protein ZOSMA_24G00470 [Zostera marina]|uniref:Uncharacterized protein n=1 Tax=Zostera marina TaxID=29655 RepID=A0A0K9PGD3_ZOSMR|nr:hypothetical protein ZOSMA_24G00470 [Zostera marina]
MIYIYLDRSTRLWRVVNFIEDHNHPLMTPSKRRYLLVNRVITPLSRALFQSLNTSNISPSDQYCVAAQEAGGFDHMQYTPSDLSNVRRDDRCNIIQRDADLLIELFEERRNKSSDFFFSFTRHDNGMKTTQQTRTSLPLLEHHRYWRARTRSVKRLGHEHPRYADDLFDALGRLRITGRSTKHHTLQPIL